MALAGLGSWGQREGPAPPPPSPGLHGQVCDVWAHGVCQLPALQVMVMLLELGGRGPWRRLAAQGVGASAITRHRHPQLEAGTEEPSGPALRALSRSSGCWGGAPAFGLSSQIHHVTRWCSHGTKAFLTALVWGPIRSGGPDQGLMDRLVQLNVQLDGSRLDYRDLAP